MFLGIGWQIWNGIVSTIFALLMTSKICEKWLTSSTEVESLYCRLIIDFLCTPPPHLLSSTVGDVMFTDLLVNKCIRIHTGTSVTNVGPWLSERCSYSSLQRYSTVVKARNLKSPMLNYLIRSQIIWTFSGYVLVLADAGGYLSSVP